MNFKFWDRKSQRLVTSSPTRGDGPYFRKPVILSEAQQKHQNLERLLALANVSDANPVWKTLLSYADEHARNEQEMALLPSLPDSVRQYNAGRAASALDFAMALRDLRAEATAEAKRMEKKKE